MKGIREFFTDPELIRHDVKYMGNKPHLYFALGRWLCEGKCAREIGATPDLAHQQWNRQLLIREPQ